MFKIILSPIASDKTTEISVNGDVLTYDNTEHDFSSILEGQQVEALVDSPAIGLIKRIDGQIEITLQYHYDSSLAEPMQSTNWDDYTFTIENGKVPCPIKWKPVPNVPPVEQVEEITEDV